MRVVADAYCDDEIRYVRSVKLKPTSGALGTDSRLKFLINAEFYRA